MMNIDQLRRMLFRIDGKGYTAYKDIQGDYDFGWFTLHIDHVQGDPFAAPSLLRARVPMNRASFPRDLFRNRVRRIALEDFAARRTDLAIFREARRIQGSGKSGMISIDSGGQEVFERTACKVTPEWVEMRFFAGLPAAGRSVLGRQAQVLLCDALPDIVQKGLLWRTYPEKPAWAFVECVENQESIRERLNELGLVAFVGDGSILPREAGNSQRPMPRDKAVPFMSPKSLRVRMGLPNPVTRDAGAPREIKGMGVPKGVTLIVGGGFHGKSTLLKALERGIYPHVPGDGREYVVTSRDAVKIRAEEGRRVERVDISPFISSLPGGTDTRVFSTDNASGSTSQAANIVEALEMGADTLLLDEDTSATNFMVRDARMQALVNKEFEPITPFLDRIRELYEALGVSTILVMGGCGDYFEAADRVIMMKDFEPREVTADAKQVAETQPTGRLPEAAPVVDWRFQRTPVPASFDASKGRKRVKIDAKALDTILYGADRIDVRNVDQIVDFSQTRAVGTAIHLASSRFMDGKRPLREALEGLDQYLDENGLDLLDPFHRGDKHPGTFARPRRYEIAAAINRLRSVKFR
ncbi:MAG: ABC-ATPase domain-containing protein [Thermodesulfobacteriota bacterium]